MPVGQGAQVGNSTGVKSNDDEGKASTKSFSNANPFVVGGQDAAGADNSGDASGKSASQVNRTVEGPGEKAQEKLERVKQQTRANAIAGTVDMTKKVPLSLAGKSGHDTLCTVTEDSVAVSGRGESACLFKQPMIKGSGFAVEIAFDVAFGSLPVEGGARHGGIFYGAKSADATRDSSPVIEYMDKAPARGYRVYGNKDIQKLDGLRPGPNPNKRWKITIQPDGKAKFEAGPRTWLNHFQPDIKGPYIGFFVSGSSLSITNIDIRKARAAPKTAAPASTRKNGLVMTAEQGYGVGTAQLFYSASGGNKGAISPRSVYLHGSSFEPRDLRTVTKQPGNIGGDVVASEVLSAGRFLEIEAAAGFGLDNDGFAGSTRIFHISQGKGHLKSNSLYLAEGNFQTEEGSIAAKKNVVAARTLKLGAMQGSGDSADNADAEFWFAEIGNEAHKIEANTVHLRAGSLATTKGNFEAQDSVSASRYLRIKSVQGTDEAKFFFSGKALKGFDSDTVFLQNGNLATATGSIYAGKDLVTNKLKINAKTMYGAGSGDMFFVQKASGKYTANSLYVSSSLATLAGSIESKKDLVSDRIVKIGTGSAKATTGGAHLLYCSSATQGNSGYEDESLYLKAGDFGAQEGSIYASEDLVATNYLTVSSSGDNFGAVESAKAKLWYAKKSSGETNGNTLFLQRGDFGTEKGNIVSPGSLIAGKNLEIHALEGFGTAKDDSVQLYYSAKALTDGNTESSLYLRKGDFRLETGSMYATDVSAKNSIKVNAKAGFGAGHASFFFVAAPFGKTTYQPQSLYLKGVDFSVPNLISSKDLVATQSAKITAKSGHGSGSAELWFGQQMSAAGQATGTVPDHVYVRTGHFATQKGDIAAKLDVETLGGEITIGDRHGAGVHAVKAGKAQLWYAATGMTGGGIAGTSLYLKKGHLATVAGNIVASRDVAAERTLKGEESHSSGDFKCKTCQFGKIFMMPHERTEISSAHASMSTNGQAEGGKKVHVGNPTLLEESMEVLLDESTGVKTRAIDVGAALIKLRSSHDNLRQEEGELTGLLSHALQRLASLEGAFGPR